MEKKIEDYLHLYFGCLCKIEGYVGDNLFHFDGLVSLENGIKALVYADNGQEYYEPHLVKPILRPLNDMTDDEVSVCWDKLGWNKGAGNNSVNRRELLFNELNDDPSPPQKHYDGIGFISMLVILPYLLSQGFDLFGLIDAGLAIDKSRTY